MDKRMEKEVLAHLESGEKIASEEYSNPALTIPVVRSDPAIPRPGPGRSQTGYGRVTNTGPHHLPLKTRWGAGSLSTHLDSRSST